MIYTPNDTEHHIPEDFSKYLAKNDYLRIFTPVSNIMKDPRGIHYVCLTEDTRVLFNHIQGHNSVASYSNTLTQQNRNKQWCLMMYLN